MASLVFIALLFTAPAFVALNAQRSAFETTLATTARERAALRAVTVTEKFLLALERYQIVLAGGGEGRAERASAHAYIGRLKVFALGEHARARRDGIVGAWATLGDRPTSARIGAIKSATIALSGAIADGAGLSFDSDSAIVNFSTAVADGLPHFIDDVDCVSSSTARAIQAGTLPTPERMATAVCLSSAGAAISGVLENDLELDSSDAVLEARVKRDLGPELEQMSGLRELAYRTLLLPASPLDGAAGVVPLGAALLQSHESIAQTLAAIVDNRLALRERRTRSSASALNYLYLAALLGGIGLVVLLVHFIGERDNKELERAQRRFREVENDLARTRAERALELSEAQFRAVFDGAPLGIAVTDEKGVIVQTNEALDDLLGLEQVLFTQNDPALLELVHDRKKSVRLERQYKRLDGETLWGELTLSMVRDHDERPQFAIGMLQDVTDRKQSELRLTHEANHDALTGLANRAHFMQRLELLQTDMRRHTRTGYTLLFIDANKFKTINDTLGHEAGDHVLKTIADRLRLCTRAEDFVARLGGDEFVVLLQGVESVQDTQRFVDAMHRQMAAAMTYNGSELTVSVSIGFASGIGDGSAERVLREADASMYQAKRSSTAREDDLAGAR